MRMRRGNAEKEGRDGMEGKEEMTEESTTVQQSELRRRRREKEKGLGYIGSFSSSLLSSLPWPCLLQSREREGRE